MIWSNRSYNARKGKIILGRGLDGMPLIKLYAPKGAEIYKGINYEYTIKKSKGEVYYINKEKDDKIFLLLNFEGNIDTGIANIYIAERNEYDIEMLDCRREFDANYNFQKVVLVEIRYPFLIYFRIEYFNESIEDEYINVVRGKVYSFKSDRKDLIKEINWMALY